jgi:hypothetical protein
MRTGTAVRRMVATTPADADSEVRMELRIEIEPGSDPIRGVLHASGPGPGHPFVGWMDLVDLIAVAADLDESPPATEHAD